MRIVNLYICSTCRAESKEVFDIQFCEAQHLGITVEQWLEYGRLNEEVRKRMGRLSVSHTPENNAAADEAIENVLAFERRLGIKKEETA
jgi:hypothetical protein